MAVVHAVGSFTITGGSTADVVENAASGLAWSDAGTHTPQWALFIAHQGSVGTNAADMRLSFGLTDGTRHYAASTYGSDNSTTSGFSATRCTNSGPVLMAAFDGAEDGLANGCTFGSNSITLTVSNAFPANTAVFYMVGAGYDNAEVLLGQRDTTTATNYDRTLAVGGFTPTCAIAINASDLTALDTGSTGGANMSLGWATGSSNQAMITNFRRASQTTNYTWGCVNTSNLLGGLGTPSGTLSRTTNLVAFIANGVTLNNGASTTAARLGILCLKGGAPLATTTTANTSTGTGTPPSVTTTGVTPDGVLGIANYPATASETTGSEPMNWGIGALDHGGNQWAVNAFEPNNETLGGAVVTETYIRSATDRFMVHWDDTGADTIAVTGDIIRSAESANTLTLNQNDADTALVLIPILVLGNAPAGGPSRSVFTTNARRYSN